MSIDKIRNIGLDKLVTQVYDFDSLTTDELLCKFAQKINIIIEHFNYLDKKIENEKENTKLKLEFLEQQFSTKSITIYNEDKSKSIVIKCNDNGEMCVNGKVIK